MSTDSLRPTIGMWALFISLFLLLNFVWGTTLFLPGIGVALAIFLIFISMIIYIYNLFASGAALEILKKIVLSILITAIATIIPIVGWIIIFWWICYNINQSFAAIKILCGDALIGFAMFGLLVCNLVYLNVFSYDVSSSHSNWFNSRTPHSSGEYVLLVLLSTAYVVFSTSFCIRALKRSSNVREMFLNSIVSILSFPIVLVIISSIISSIRNISKITSVQNRVRSPQAVQSHMRGHQTAGMINVRGYTRQITTTMTKFVVIPGEGITGIGTVGALSQEVKTASTSNREK